MLKVNRLCVYDFMIKRKLISVCSIVGIFNCSPVTTVVVRKVRAQKHLTTDTITSLTAMVINLN